MTTVGDVLTTAGYVMTTVGDVMTTAADVMTASGDISTFFRCSARWQIRGRKLAATRVQCNAASLVFLPATALSRSDTPKQQAKQACNIAL